MSTNPSLWCDICDLGELVFQFNFQLQIIATFNRVERAVTLRRGGRRGCSILGLRMYVCTQIYINLLVRT